MSFYMPTVNLDKVPEKSKKIMERLVEQNRLVTMPRFDVDDNTKIIHNHLLKMLYSDKRWMVPIDSAWQMPHLTKSYGYEKMCQYELEAEQIYFSGCFGSPRPVYLEDKQYIVTKEDGKLFILKVQ